ncbi:hypothetical protein [Pedobacter sp. NJ-S-72]
MQFDKGLSLPFLSAEFFGVTNAHDIKWVNERLTNQPYRTFTQSLVLKTSIWQPTTAHLHCLYKSRTPGHQAICRRNKGQ